MAGVSATVARASTLSVIREVGICMETGKADRPAVEGAVRQLYKVAGFKQPKAMIWVDSPLAGAHAKSILAGRDYEKFPRSKSIKSLRDPFLVKVREDVLAQLPRSLRFRRRVMRGFYYLGGDEMVMAHAIGKKVLDLDKEELAHAIDKATPISHNDTLQPEVRALISATLGNALGSGSSVLGAPWGRWSADIHRDRGDFSSGMIGEMFFMLLSISSNGLFSFDGDAQAVSVLRYLAGDEADGLDSLFWVLGDFVILVDKPVEYRSDAMGRVHSQEGAAIRYGDGFTAYAWHGTAVPESLVTGDGWDVNTLTAERNVEVRRCAIERMGWDRFIKDADLKQIGQSVADPGNPGQMLSLYHAPKVTTEPVRLLLCENATPERDGQRHRFGLTVPVTIKNPIEAAAWTFGVTAKDYAKLQRAT